MRRKIVFCFINTIDHLLFAKTLEQIVEHLTKVEIEVVVGLAKVVNSFYGDDYSVLVFLDWFNVYYEELVLKRARSLTQSSFVVINHHKLDAAVLPPNVHQVDHIYAAESPQQTAQIIWEFSMGMRLN